MPLKWLKVMVEEKRNTLLRPISWEDPYEMNYSNSVISTGHGDIPLDASHWFGQCWSLCEESAIMWQAFKKDKDPYVKIKIDAKDLTKDLCIDNGLSIAVLEYIRYFEPTTNDYLEKIRDIISTHQWFPNFIEKGVTFAELYPMYNLLTKRIAFKHEEEVRLLLLDKSSTNNTEFVNYPFDPKTIIEVTIDPWTSKEDDKCNEIIEGLRVYLPSETTKIKKSELFNDSCKFSTKFIVRV